MKKETLYLKIEQNTEVLNKNIYLQDFAKLYCRDASVLKELNHMLIWTAKETKDTKYMFSILKIIEKIEQRYPEISVVNLGETDFIITYKVSKKKSKAFEYGKAGFVALTAFFGGAFSIMTFNTDVSVGDVFDLAYKLVLGQEQSGAGVVEAGYSIGLFLGIMIFYNHFFRKIIHEDPTPIQVEMRKYEKELNSALIQDTAREGKTIDVG